MKICVSCSPHVIGYMLSDLIYRFEFKAALIDILTLMMDQRSMSNVKGVGRSDKLTKN